LVEILPDEQNEYDYRYGIVGEQIYTTGTICVVWDNGEFDLFENIKDARDALCDTQKSTAKVTFYNEM